MCETFNRTDFKDENWEAEDQARPIRAEERSYPNTLISSTEDSPAKMSVWPVNGVALPWMRCDDAAGRPSPYADRPRHVAPRTHTPACADPWHSEAVGQAGGGFR